MSLAEYASVGTIVAALFGVVSFFQWGVASKSLLLGVMDHVHKRYSDLYDCLVSLPEQVQTYGDLSVK
jgi:hypothetical protein